MITLGHFKKQYSGNPNSAVYKNTMVVHDIVNDPTLHAREFSNENKGGLHRTKFGTGFNRRNQSSIENLSMNERLEHQNACKERNVAMAHSRSEMLKTIDNYNGYNIITGAERNGRVVQTKPEGLRNCGDGLGPEASHRAHITLRDSKHRFFTPQYSGQNHEYRQDVLVRDGCLKSKCSSLIQLGKNDLPSSGVEDQFSKSCYTNKSLAATTGLVESRAVGRYTPRKQANNPSGDMSVTSTWGKGVALSLSGSM